MKGGGRDELLTRPGCRSSGNEECAQVLKTGDLTDPAGSAKLIRPGWVLPKQFSFLINRRLFVDKELYKYQTRNKAADMRCIGNTTGRFISTQHSHAIDQLKNKPDTYHQKSRQ